MLSYNSLTYVQDMKIGHYSEFPLRSKTNTCTHAVLLHRVFAWNPSLWNLIANTHF